MTLLQNFADLVFDPFRIGLLAALLFTIRRNVATTGVWIPLAAGIIFVAALIATTLTPPADGNLIKAILMGLLANIIIISLFWLAYSLWRSARPR